MHRFSHRKPPRRPLLASRAAPHIGAISSAMLQPQAAALPTACDSQQTSTNRIPALFLSFCSRTLGCNLHPKAAYSNAVNCNRRRTAAQRRAEMHQLGDSRLRLAIFLPEPGTDSNKCSCNGRTCHNTQRRATRQKSEADKCKRVTTSITQLFLAGEGKCRAAQGVAQEHVQALGGASGECRDLQQQLERQVKGE